MTSFGWLHLTDLHLGMDQQRGLLPTVEDKFFDDLSKSYEKTAPWDLVIFSGDLTFTGAADEFKRFDDFLERLWGRFRKLGANPSLVAVPGNHDLVRPDINNDKAARLLRNSWHDDPDLQKQFWADATSDYRKTINGAFENYARWWEKTQFKLVSSQSGELPGDFSAVFTKGEISIGIVGLNVAFLQLGGGDYKGKLAVDPLQFQNVCGGNGPAWVKQHNATLLVTHQPPDWLNEAARIQLDSDISSYFDVHLFGHMHDSRYGVQVAAGGPESRVFQATSLFGLEEFGDSPKNQRRHGYAIGRITLEQEKGKLIVWPRKVRRVDNVWNFVIDQENIFMDDDHTVPREFTLKKPLLKTQSSTSVAVTISESTTTTVEIQSPGKRWAFVVGVNEYKHFSKLKYCQQDAVELARVLREKLEFNKVYEFHDEAGPDFQPTRDCILDKLADIRDQNECKANDLLLFYFSGHGINEGGKDYLLPINARPRDIDSLGIRVKDLVKSLKGFGCANTMLFLDACRDAVSGAKGTASIGEDSSALVTSAEMMAFFSCDPRERSYEIERLKHGSFTYCILKAIEDSAVSTLNDLKTYLEEQVPKVNQKYDKPAQRPLSIIVPATRGELMILHSSRQPGQDYDELKFTLFALNAKGKISADDLVSAVAFLDKISIASRLYENDTTSLEVIKALCDERWKPETFSKFWKMLQSRRLPSPELKKPNPSLN